MQTGQACFRTPAPFLHDIVGNLEAHLVIYAGDITGPFAMIFVEHLFRHGFAAGNNLAQRVQKAGFIITTGIQAVARGKSGRRNVKNTSRKIKQLAATGYCCVQALRWHCTAQRFAFFHRPMLYFVPCSIKRALIVQQADPECGQRTDAVPWTTIRAAHFQEALQAHFGEGGRAPPTGRRPLRRR